MGCIQTMSTIVSIKSMYHNSNNVYSQKSVWYPPVRAHTHVSSSLPLRQNGVVLGCGMICQDYLAMVDAYPRLDEKIECTNCTTVEMKLPTSSVGLRLSASNTVYLDAWQRPRVREMTSAATLSMEALRFSPSSSFTVSSRFFTTTSTTRTKMASVNPSIRASTSSSSSHVTENNSVVLGCGAACIDFLATVDSYPNPDDKIRSTSLKIQGGGNAGNALTCAARLGLTPRLISKVADDAQGKGILEELEADGVDTSFFVVSSEGNSPFTYVIVDKQTKTRTCIHTPLYPPMMPDDLPQSTLFSALDRARLVYFDGRLHETALVVGKEASQRKIPILVDAEKKREGLDDLLKLADYVVCSARFPREWTDAPTTASALVSMLLRLPNVKFVISTLGEDGCIMLERSTQGSPQSEEMDVDTLLELLKQSIDGNSVIPTFISSKSVMSLKANKIGALNGKLHIGTAEKIPPSELVDTTGAGDAFIGAVLYALCADKPPEKMLPFAASVAAAACRALGARSGLPKRTDPCFSLLH